MGYDIALNKAWDEFLALNPEKPVDIKFLADTYTVDLEAKKVLSLSCNIAAKDFTVILLLHYLSARAKGLPKLTQEWVSFKELSGVQGYYPAFKARAIDPIIRKYGARPDAILDIVGRLPAKKVDQGDVGVVIEVLDGVAAMVTLWRPDEEFGPEANILFDKNITQIFCTEDIVVLAGIIAHSL